MLKPRALFFLLLSNFLGGSSYIAAVYALKGFSVRDCVFWRMAAAAALFLPALPRLRGRGLERRDWLLMAGVGVLGYAVPLLLGTLGLSGSSATHGVLLVAMEPVAIVTLAALFLGEPFSALKAGSLALGLCGTALIVSQGRLSAPAAEASRVSSDLMLAATGFLWGLYTIFSKPVLRKLDARTFTAATTLIAFAAVAAAGMPRALPGGSTPPAAWLGEGYLVLVTFLGAWCWNKAVELVPVSQVASFVFVQPLVGVLLGVLLGRENLSLWSAAGGLFVILAATAAAQEEA